MTGFDIFLHTIEPIGLIFFLYLFYKNIYLRKKLGKRMFKIGKIKLLALIWIALAIYWLYFCFSNFESNFSSYYNTMSGIIHTIMTILIWITLSFYNALICVLDEGIYKSGISTDRGIFYWNDIVSYQWNNQRELQFNVKTRMLFLIFKKNNKGEMGY